MKTKTLTFCRKNSYFVGCATIVPFIGTITGHILLGMISYSVGYTITLLIERLIK